MHRHGGTDHNYWWEDCYKGCSRNITRITVCPIAQDPITALEATRRRHSKRKHGSFKGRVWKKGEVGWWWMTRIDEKIRWAMKMGRMQHMTPKGGSTQHDTYSRETTSAPPTGWLSYETCCRQITDLQDMVWGMDERLAVREAILSDYSPDDGCKWGWQLWQKARPRSAEIHRRCTLGGSFPWKFPQSYSDVHER